MTSPLRACHQVVLCLHQSLCMMKQRNTDAGFTMAGMMAVVGALGVAAAFGAPRLNQQGPAGPAGGFAGDVVKELQRARAEAITTRVPRHAFVYSNRVEIRAAKRSARGTWVAPTLSDPVLRMVHARPGINSFDVTRRPSLPDFTLSPASSKEIVFATSGAGSLGATASTRPSSLHLYINNDTVKVNHPDREYRIDIAPGSGDVSLKTSW
jgi:Tfp pilus assembly protein FimT